MATTAAVQGHAARRGVPTAPTVFGSFGNVANAASVALTLPASLANGDIGIIVANTDPNGTITTPAGWTRIGFKGDNGSATPSTVCYLFKKILATGDSSTTVTLTRVGATAPIVGAGVVVRGGSDVGALAISRNPLVVNPAGKTVKLAAVRPGKQDLVIAFHTARAYTNAAAAAAQMVTPPAGFTVRQNRSTAYTPGLTTEWAASIMDGAASSADGVALTGVLTDQSYMVGGMLTISPAGRRPTNKLPASLANVAVHGYGTSYLGVASDATAHACESVWYDRIAALLGTPAENNNMGLPGAMASDICGGAYGTISYYTRAVQLDPNFAQQQAQTWMAQGVRSGLLLLDLFGNDGFNHASTASGGTTAKSLAGARSAGESLVRLLRASSMVNETDGTIAYAGTWTANSGVGDFSSGSNKQTTVPGSTATITVTQPDIDLVLFATDDSAFGVTGSAFQVKVDGVLFTTGTTSNKMRKSSSTVYNAAAYTQLTVPVRGMGAGSHTIELMHTGAGGNALFFDGYLIPAATPPLIVLNKLAHYSSAALAALPAPSSNAILDLYSQIAQDIADLFPDGRVMTFDPLEDTAWDYTTMVTTYDNIHLNDVGAAHYARGIAKLLQERVA